MSVPDNAAETVAAEGQVATPPPTSTTVPTAAPTPVACDESCVFYSLDTARTGEEFEIVRVDDEHARVQCLRFGMAEGACVKCVTRIPAGPLVLKSGRQEIAVGRGLAKRIQVRGRRRGNA